MNLCVCVVLCVVMERVHAAERTLTTISMFLKSDLNVYIITFLPFNYRNEILIGWWLESIYKKDDEDENHKCSGVWCFVHPPFVTRGALIVLCAFFFCCCSNRFASDHRKAHNIRGQRRRREPKHHTAIVAENALSSDYGWKISENQIRDYRTFLILKNKYLFVADVCI